MAKRSGALGAGAGIFAGLAALAAGGVAAGLELERRIVSSRRRAETETDEGFFQLRGRAGRILSDDGVSLYTEVDEPAAGCDPDQLTVVFVHGYALNQDCFHFQRRHLRGRYRLVFYDQRSHGRSGRSTPENCRLSQLGQDLYRVLTQLVPTGPIVLIGHSMGGMTIMNLARTHPELFGERVVGVVLMSTSPGGLANLSPIRGIPGRQFGWAAQWAMSALNRVPKLVDASRRASTDIGFVATKQFAFGSDVPASYVDYVSTMLADTPLQVVEDFYPGFADIDETAAFDVLAQVETAVIGGRQDLFTPVEHTETIITLLPGADAVIVDECGHLGLIEHHQIFNDVVDQLLRRVERNLADRRNSAATGEDLSPVEEPA